MEVCGPALLQRRPGSGYTVPRSEVALRAPERVDRHGVWAFRPASRSAMALDVASVERSTVHPGAASFPRRTRGNGVRGDDDASLLPIEAGKDVETYTTYQLRDVCGDACTCAVFSGRALIFLLALLCPASALLHIAAVSLGESGKPLLARTRRVSLARRGCRPPGVRLGSWSRRKGGNTSLCTRTLERRYRFRG